MPSPTRRALLAAAGTVGFAGCSSLDRLVGRPKPDPAPFLHEPTDWAHPGYDAGNTGAAPGAAAPESLAATPTWTAEIEADEVDHVHTPVIADGVVYLPVRGYDRGEEFERLVAFDAGTGEERWRRETRDSGNLHTPAVARETVYWLTDANRRLALNAADGSPRWERGGANHRPPVPAHGVVLDVGGSSTDPRLVARDPATGDPYWRRGNEGDWQPLGADGDQFYARLDARTAEGTDRLHAVDPTTGETRWATDRVAPFLEPLAAGEGRVFGTDGRPDSQRLVALDARTGERVWSIARDLQRPFDDGERLVNGEQPPVALADDTLLVHVGFHGAYDDRIEARDPATGDVRWTYGDDGDDDPVSFGRPAVAGDRVFLTAVTDRRGDGYPSGSLRTLSLADGTERERLSLDAPSFEGPVLAGGRCLVVTRGEEGGLSLVARE